MNHLSRERALETFQASQQLESQALAVICNTNKDQREREFLVQNTYISDYLLLNYAVDLKKLTSSIIFYKLDQLPDMEEKIKKNRKLMEEIGMSERMKVTGKGSDYMSFSYSLLGGSPS